MEYDEDDLIKRLPSKSGKIVRSKAIKPGPRLRMFLDEDRDGAVDDKPAKCVKWKWGECKKGEHKGAIILVKNQQYKLIENVDERLAIKIGWDDQKGELSKEWAATLQIAENPDQIRIYNNLEEGAEQVLGKGIEGNLFAIHDDDVLSFHLNAGQAVILWMEAVDYAQEADGSDACITLQLKFTDLRFKGLAQTTIVQEAQIRIAPWIMASDLDETKVIFARAPKEGDCVARQIEKFSKNARCNFQPIGPAKAKKGFMRDVIKSGYVAWPGEMTTLVVLERLDKSAQLSYFKVGKKGEKRELNLDDSIKDENIALATVPQKFELWPKKWRTSQDNGGNYLVSPSTKENPWGRLIFGEGFKYHQDRVCNIGDFLCAQRLQQPIILDPTWLSVGHVDELIAFIPNPYKVLISNSRLAYVLLYGIAWALSKPNPDNSSESMLKVVRACARRIELKIREDNYKDKYGSDFIKLLEKYFCKFSELKHKLSDGEKSDGNFVEYKPDDSPPQGYSGRMIIPQKNGLKFDAKDISDFLEISKGNIASTEIFKNAVQAQQRIDEGSREILKKELKLKESDFIDLPVLFSGDNEAHAITGDSTNMLIITKDKKCHCLIAKPFGPVYDGKYVFQEYIRQQLVSIAEIKEENIAFANNWADMHSSDGEIHCGTNQLPAPLPEDKCKWWTKEPPQIVKRELGDSSKKDIKAEPKLTIEFVNPPEECFVDVLETEIKIVNTVANEKLEYSVRNLEAGDIIKVHNINHKLLSDPEPPEFKTTLAPETEIAVIKATAPKLHISPEGPPVEGCEVEEKLTVLNLNNAIKDHTVQYSIADLIAGQQITVSDVWNELCSGGEPGYTIQENNSTVVAEIIQEQESFDAPPPLPPPPMQS